MKLFHKLYFILLVLFLSVNLTHAQDNRTLETKVADILTETPTQDLAHLNKLMEEMIGLGDEGIQLFINQLVPPGKGDDSRVRDALESLSRYLSSSNNKEGKRIFINSIKKTIISDVDDAVKVYLIRRLDVLIDTEDIEFLTNQLEKPALMEAAAKALLTTNNPAIEAHLVKKLKSSEGETKIRIIKALGELSSAKATTTLSEELKGATGPLRIVILYTLGQSGHENAYEPLFNAAKEVGFKYEETNATSSFISLGERAVALNNIALGKMVSEAIIEQCTANEQLHFRARAISILSKTLKPASYNKILLKEFKSSNSPYRGALLNHAVGLEGDDVTKSWSKAFLKAPNEAKVEILGMLFTRGDASALPALDKVVTYDDLPVMEALLQTRAKLGKKEAIPGILGAMKEERLATAGKNALLGITDNKDLSTLIAVINSLPPTSKAAVIDVIAARRGSNYFTDIEAMLSDNSEVVQLSAYKALEKVVTADHINVLNQLYANASTENASYITSALIAALKQIDSEEKRIDKTLEILNNSPSAAHVLSLTPEIGGNSVREAVLKAFKNGNNAEAAFDALCRWPDASVAGEVFTICENSTGDKRKKAFEGFLRLSTLENVPADQQLLMLRKIMPLAKDIDEKNQVIRSLARVRTFPSLVYVSRYLEDENLKAIASRAVMNICLPQPSDKSGLTGALVEEALIKSIDVMSGPESQYMKEDIRVYLRQMAKTTGFVSMFNGKDLTGWKGYVDNPINVAKMKPEELAKKQEIADEALKANWSVKDGHIHFSGKGENLLSVKDYGDFEMYCDWKISKDGDSGIYLRGSPQVQIWDTSRVESGAQVGSGGLFNNKIHPDKPLVVADNPVNEWNTFYIKMIGEKVTVRLNGVTVVDEVVLENYWNRELPIFPTGTIELQAHGTDLEFRDIYVREISSPDFSVTPEEKLEGYVSLFNGKDLEGWQGNKTDYVADEGTIAIYPRGGSHGNLFSNKEYTNFSFRFDFLLTEGANNGIGIHAPLSGDAAYAGKEVQVLDNTASIYANIHDYQFHGSLYGIMPAKRGFLKPVGEWNTEEIRVQGNRITVTLNGTVILEGDYVEASKNGTLDQKDHPGITRKTGYIGFLGHGTVVKFRNIRIKEL